MNLLISCQATAFILAYNRQLGDRALRTLVATANGEAPVPLLENEETWPAGNPLMYFCLHLRQLLIACRNL